MPAMRNPLSKDQIFMEQFALSEEELRNIWIFSYKQLK
jgi:hypothetical protein